MNRTLLICVWVISLGFLSACSSTGGLHREGLKDVAAGNYEVGIQKLKEAANNEPENLTLRLDLKTQREQVVQKLVAMAETALVAGDFSEAERSYRRVLTVEKRNGRALRGIESIVRKKVHHEQIVNAERLSNEGDDLKAEAMLRAVLAEDPTNSSARMLLERIQLVMEPENLTPTLANERGALVSLQFREADTRMVFEVLARQTGINFIFDKDVKSETKTTIFVQEVPVEQAIDLVIAQNMLARQILSENMVMIYPNTPAKQKEYQQQVVRTLYVVNAQSKTFGDMLKTMLNVETLFVDERANAVILRDSPEVIRMAEQLLASIDVPESEVMMEVEVLEITRSRLQQLGINYPGSVTINPTALAGDPLVLADLGEQDRTSLTVSAVPITFDLRKEAGISNLLASPRIRARNHEIAKVVIGQRVPVITNSVTPTATGASVVTGSIQYVDVGLLLEVEPTIYLDGDVAIRVDLEVSNIIREISNPNSGTLAYQIGTRNASTTLRLKSGETQILAGLIQDIDRTTSNHIPGLGDMPLLGRLFGSKKDDVEKTEIVLSITPRIVRQQPRAASNNTEFWYGTESKSHTAIAARGRSSRLREVNRQNVQSSSRGANKNSDKKAASDKSSTPPPQRLSLDWIGPEEVGVGEEFSVTLTLDSPTPIHSLRSQVRFDQSALELVSSEVGSVAPANKTKLESRSGRAKLDIDELKGDSISGSGSLLVLNFKSLVPRPATMISVQQFAASGEDGLSVPVIAPRPLVISVKRL